MLDDICAIELSGGLSTAFCGRLLADAGATVFRSVDFEPPSEHGSYVHAGKSGERSEITPEEAASIDVAIRDQAEPGSDHILDVIRRHNDRLIVVTLSDYGTSGPDASTPASELTLQAESGIVALHPLRDRPPVRCGVDLGALTGGLCGALAALMALHSRDHGASAIDVDVSRFEALISTLQYPWLYAQFPEHYEYPVPMEIVPGVEPARDGWVCVVAITPQQWTDFKKLVGAPELEDPRFDAPSERIRFRAKLSEHVRVFTRARTVAELVELGAANRVPIVPVSTPEQVAGLPPYAGRGRSGEGAGMSAPFRLVSGPQSAAPSAPPAAVCPSIAGLGEPERPLEGLRVVEFGTFQAGPLVTAHLAALGADVIKVESITRPDLIRFTGTPFTVERCWERSAAFAGVNLGKRAITIDLVTAAGKGVLRRLIGSSDMIVDNYSPRVLEKLGFGYTAVRELRPDIIMLRMPAWGLEGPWRDWPGFIFTANAACGLGALTGYPDDEPLLTGTIIDPIAGFLGALVGLCAIRRRRATGEGCLVEVPLCDVAAQLTADAVGAASGDPVARRGNRSHDSAPSGIYRCWDRRWLAISVRDDAQWRALCALDRIGPDLADRRFADVAGRRDGHNELDALLAAVCTGATSGELVGELRGAGIPAAIVESGVGAVKHRQLVARDRVFTVTHPVVGTASYVGLPMRFSNALAAGLPRPAPLLGQDNADVLAALGYDSAQIDRMARDRVIGWSPG